MQELDNGQDLLPHSVDFSAESDERHGEEGVDEEHEALLEGAGEGVSLEEGSSFVELNGKRSFEDLLPSCCALLFLFRVPRDLYSSVLPRASCAEAVICAIQGGGSSFERSNVSGQEHDHSPLPHFFEFMLKLDHSGRSFGNVFRV